MHGQSVVGTNFQIGDSAGWGLWSESRIRLTNPSVVGSNGFGVGLDLLSRHRPLLFNTTCGRSDTGRGTSWGVCTND